MNLRYDKTLIETTITAVKFNFLEENNKIEKKWALEAYANSSLETVSRRHDDKQRHFKSLLRKQSESENS